MYIDILVNGWGGQSQGLNQTQKEGLTCSLGRTKAEKNLLAMVARNSFNRKYIVLKIA